MKRVFCLAVGGVVFVASALAQTDPDTQPIPLYENYAIIQDSPAPEIDALAFANYGVFDVSGPSIVPYDFQNVRHFTNSGSMIGNSGFRFDTEFRDRPRQPAEDFVNKATGTIQGSVYLLVSATNLVNEGLMSAGPNGLVRLEGKNVNLTRSGLQVEPLGVDTGTCFPLEYDPFVVTNEFYGDPSIIDAYANIGTNGMAVDRLISLNPDGTVSVNAPQPVGNLPSAKAYLRTNAPTATNLTVQAVFVQGHDADVTFDVKFADDGPVGNNPPFLVPIIKISTTESNVVTGQDLRKSVYLIDRLAAEKVVGAETNLVFYTNTVAGTLVPSPLFVTRDAPCEFDSALGTNAIVRANLFFNQSFSNTFVTNVNASYIANVQATAGQPPAVTGSTLSNLASRLEIRAETLDLTKTRMRADGIVKIVTDNLITSTGAVVAVANLSYDLNARGHELLIKDLSVPQIRVFDGTIAAWTGYWTNQTGSTVTNIGPDPNDPTITVTNIATNTVDILYHALFVDNRMTSVGIVAVNDMTLRGTNVVFGDQMTVNEAFTVYSDTFTMAQDGSLQLPGAVLTGLGTGIGRGVDSWTGTNVPNLMILTNLGTIVAVNKLHLGNDRPKPYQRVVNSGSLQASSLIVQSEEFENTGEVLGVQSLSVIAQSGRLEGGTFTSENDIRLAGGDLKLRNHTQSSSALYIMVTNSLFDSGGDAQNTVTCTAGFNLLIKPAHGALLGTTFASTAPRYANIVHRWAAEDRGAVADGFTDNAAIGHLTLDVGLDAALTFAGTGLSNAIYVDVLELSSTITNDLANTLFASPGFVIYFAYANVPVEQLDGQLNGRLRWVKDYSDGPNSSVDVLLRSGQTTRMNRALRFSTTIDTDGDGWTNGSDPYPLDPDPAALGALSVSSWLPLEATIAAKAVGNVIWQVEYTTDLSNPTWQVYGRFTNQVPTNGSFLLSIPDPLPAGQQQRFYRVKLNP